MRVVEEVLAVDETRDEMLNGFWSEVSTEARHALFSAFERMKLRTKVY
jgi:hypothetical protein